MSRAGKSLEIENKLVVVKGWADEEYWGVTAKRPGFLLGATKMS